MGIIRNSQFTVRYIKVIYSECLLLSSIFHSLSVDRILHLALNVSRQFKNHIRYTCKIYAFSHLLDVKMGSISVVQYI